MKINFDTNTKDVDAATAAFNSLYPYCKDLSMNKSKWEGEYINIYGSIDTENLDILQGALPNGTFNEDTEKL
jgi:hypothetical protein